MSPIALTNPAPLPVEEISAQLQRVDTLHQQHKAEQARALEFLAKLRRGEEIRSHQSQAQSSPQSSRPKTSPSKTQRGPASIPTEKGDLDSTEPLYCCEHHAAQLSEKDRRMAENDRRLAEESRKLSEKNRRLAEEYRKFRAAGIGAAMPGLPQLPAHVDEKEVRDLEKRVRGLEGRVRGFEGLPPDREMALLEVERLRKELEGLARRREGLFGLVEERIRGGKGVGNARGRGTVTGARGKANGVENGNAKGSGGVTRAGDAGAKRSNS